MPPPCHCERSEVISFPPLEDFYLPHPLCPPLHDMDIYSYHEGEEKERGASAPLKRPALGGVVENYGISNRRTEGGLGWEEDKNNRFTSLAVVYW